MSAPTTFSESLAHTLLDSFGAAYYAATTETQRKAVLKGAAQVIECRLRQKQVDTSINPDTSITNG
jgi:hypothetical protein